MTNVVPGLKPGFLRWPALFGLVLWGSIGPASAGSQTLDSLAPLPSDSLGALPSDSPSPLSVASKVNPFAGFETHYLSNGLKVWFKRLPEAPNVSISVGVPFGWDADPRGKEELAHLTEHILFTDHEGQTEREIADAIEGVGGRRNGFTTPDHTWYYVTVSKEHGSFAIEWLSRVMSPHAIDASVVERNRQPVALEIDAQQREFFEQLWGWLNPSWLLPPDFWEREFGMQTRSARQYDPWASLQRITAEDVTNFYDRYYVPEAMTLTVIGDLDRDEVLAISERTFGSLVTRPVPPRDVSVEDPARQRSTSYWGFGSNVRYTTRYKLFNSDTEDDLMLLFVRDLLGRRLNQRLRYGEQKAVYGLQVTSAHRGPGGFLEIDGSIAEDEYDFARGIIREEIAALVGGTLPPEEFEADRTALVERLRGENSTAQALNFWVLRNFYDPSKHADFPDLISFFSGVTQGEVAAFAARTFAPEREATTLVGVQPMSQGMLAAAALVLMFLTIRGLAWTLTRPVTMPKILYIARFRTPIPLQVGAVILIGGIGLIVGRLIVFGVQSLALAFVVTIDDYLVQLWFYGATLIVVVGISVLLLSRVPRKIIVFPDHLRIKFLAYRSRILKPDDFLELSTRRGHQVWFRKDLFRCVPLSFGLAGPGIYMRPIKGRAYFFRTRDTVELVDVLGGWRGASVSAAAVKRKPKDFVRDPFEEAMDTSDWISSMAPDQVPEDDSPLPSIAMDPLPETEEPSASIALEPLPGIEEPSAPIAVDPPPGIEELAPDPLPGIEEPPASIPPSPLPEIEKPPATIARDLLLGDADVSDNGGLEEDELKDLLGDAYKRDVEKKF